MGQQRFMQMLRRQNQGIGQDTDEIPEDVESQNNDETDDQVIGTDDPVIGGSKEDISEMYLIYEKS